MEATSNAGRFVTPEFCDSAGPDRGVWAELRVAKSAAMKIASRIIEFASNVRRLVAKDISQPNYQSVTLQKANFNRRQRERSFTGRDTAYSITSERL